MALLPVQVYDQELDQQINSHDNVTDRGKLMNNW